MRIRGKVEKIFPERREGARWWRKAVIVAGVLVVLGTVGAVAGPKAARWIGERREQASWRREAKVALRQRARTEVEEQIEEERRLRERQEKERKRRERLAAAPLVALTFDDGPGGATTERLLDILADKGAKATFFVVGTRVEAMPWIVQREVAEGHQVGSHTTAHIDLSEIGSAEEMQEEMAEMGRMMAEAGVEMTLLRPPYGRGIDKAEVTENVGLPIIYWSVDPGDWAVLDKDAVRDDVLAHVYDGAVVLMHDLYATTVDAAGEIIDALKAQGYEFVTIAEMAEVKGAELPIGVVRYGF